MVKKLLDEILIHVSVSGSLKDPGKEYAILRIRWKNLISTIPMKTSNLHRCYSERRPASSPEADPLITPRLIHINEMIQAKLRQIAQIIVSKVCVTFLSNMACSLLRPSNGLQSSADAGLCDVNVKLIVQKDNHLILE
jgi:hypothetical protein